VSVIDPASVILLTTLGISLAAGFMLLGGMIAIRRWQRLTPVTSPPVSLTKPRSRNPTRPTCWIAIRSISPDLVSSALGLQRTAPCSWVEGLNGGHEFFISPQVNGWVIVTGMGIPNPTDDVDATFIFLSALSRQLGHVQYFYASRLLHHHAWARLDDGCVTRAYAWAGETVWNQGSATLPEIEAKVKLFNYGEHSATIVDAEENFQQLPLLAARWSLDPAAIKLKFDQKATGIAGESAPF
jgi:hypothetical protein